MLYNTLWDSYLAIKAFAKTGGPGRVMGFTCTKRRDIRARNIDFAGYEHKIGLFCAHCETLRPKKRATGEELYTNLCIGADYRPVCCRVQHPSVHFAPGMHKLLSKTLHYKNWRPGEGALNGM